MIKKLLLFLLTFWFAAPVLSNTCTTNAGTFASWLALTWTCSGSPAGGPPGCGDVMNIAAGTTVNVSADVDYSACGSPITLNIYGTMNFNTNGVRFKLPPGSSVFLGSGGSINKTYPGGGSSTLISIAGETIWDAGDGTITGPQTLPVELLAFTATPATDKILIKWSTASEVHNDYFTIQRSGDAANFISVGTVEGAGNSISVLNYSYSDPQPLHGVNYYRLLQTDYDGHFAYSDVISAHFQAASELSFNLFPNPNDGDIIFISFGSLETEEVAISVRDILGKEVFSKTVVIKSNGENLFSIDPEIQLGQGVYSITASGAQTSFSKRWVVQ